PFALSDGLKIVRCHGCGLLFVNPRPNAASVAEHFEKEYVRDEGRATRELMSFREESLQREALFLRRMLPEGGRLLDVGAASGAFLRLFLDDPAWKAEGVEPSVFAARYAREKLGLTVSTGFLRDQRFSSGSFDVITSLDAFMLHAEPNEDLAEMARILRPGGLLAIEIPGLWFRLHKNKGLLCRLLYGVPVRLNPREHLYYYSRETLARLCEKHGLDLVASHPERSPAHGSAVFRGFASAYYAASAALYRLSHAALHLAPKELLVFRKRVS
ncbi:MAG: class I SAM-dependent methyltransferase, partial [Thermoanaerobaculia bacterium]